MFDHRDLHEAFAPSASSTLAAETDEILVSDARGDMSPAQMVEQKLMALLWGRPGTVSSPNALQTDSRQRG
jgi:hypothetical protein